MTPAATPAFLIGVTGHMDLRDEEIPRLQKQIRLLFRFLKRGADAPDPDAEGASLLDSLVNQLPDQPAHGAHGGPRSNPYRAVLQHWTGLPHTPVVVLSSLAPGADTLCAQIALEDEFRGMQFFVRAPLPFPPDQYALASTFKPATSGEGKTADTLQRTYEALLDQVGRENAFLVRLAEDLDLSGDRLLARCQADRDDPDPARRRRRYRASGEFMAAYSHLMIAIWDEEENSNTAEGAAAIVEARRSGPQTGLLPDSHPLALPHGGPIVHLRTRRGKSRAPALDGQTRSMRLLHPYRSIPPGASGDDDPAWHEQNLGVSLRIAANLDSFNAEPAASAEQASDELNKRLTYQAADGGKRSYLSVLETSAPASARPMAQGLRDLAAVRAQASLINRAFDARARNTLKRLFLLSFAAAVLLHLFAHWHREKPHGESAQGGAELSRAAPAPQSPVDSQPPPAPEAKDARPKAPAKSDGSVSTEGAGKLLSTAIRVSAGALSLGLACYGLFFFWKGRQEQDGERAHDYRALAEGLRVQFAWNLAGVGRSVPANYMQRQRSELDWIRGAVRAVSFPYERWREAFAALDRSCQIAALRAVRDGWVADQARYFDQQMNRRRGVLHFWHKLGGTLALAGLWSVLFLCIGVIPGDHFHWLESWLRPLLILASALLLLGLAWGVARQWLARGHGAHAPHASLIARALDLLAPTGGAHHGPPLNRKQRSGEMLVGLAGQIPLSAAMALYSLAAAVSLSRVGELLPDAFNLTIIATGIFLLAGALAIAWAEKNLYSELAYQYSTMSTLFHAARLHVDGQIKRLEALQNDPAFDAVLADLQTYLFELGKEALDENAEWLILHRARPLEPVMAG